MASTFNAQWIKGKLSVLISVSEDIRATLQLNNFDDAAKEIAQIKYAGNRAVASIDAMVQAEIAAFEKKKGGK